MKKSIFTLGIFILLGIYSSFAQDFNIKTEVIFESSSYTNMQHVKSAVDSKNNLHIVFLDGSSAIPYYATNQSGTWEFQKLEYFDDEYNETAKVSSFPNIAIDSKDNISIVMFGRYKENLVSATKHVSKSDWKFSSTKETSHLNRFLVYGNYTDMCVDKKGGLHVICQADFWDKSGKKHDQSAVYFYKSATGKWEIQVVKKGIVNEFAYGQDPSIATFGNKVYALLGGSNHLHFAEKNISGGNWNIEELFFHDNNYINTQKFETSLTVSPNGNPKFAFYEYFSENSYENHGLLVMSKNNCKNDNWVLEHAVPEKVYKRSPAIGIDNNGKMYLALGGKELHLYTKTCECTPKWELLLKDNNINCDYTDIVIDKKNTVHVFYAYEKKVYHLKAVPKSPTVDCNFSPSISFVGKTNIKVGDNWSAKIITNDPECDPVEIYSIFLPSGFVLTDHKNGTATITGPVNEVKEHFFTVFCTDNKHQQNNNRNSAATITLKVTDNGTVKGSVKYKNHCDGTIIYDDNSNNNNNNNNGDADGNSQINDNNGVGGNGDCEKFIQRYEAFADKYVPVIKKVKANPTDANATMELSDLMTEYATFASEWTNLFDCHNIPEFQKRYDAASKKIQDANK